MTTTSGPLQHAVGPDNSAVKIRSVPKLFICPTTPYDPGHGRNQQTPDAKQIETEAATRTAAVARSGSAITGENRSNKPIRKMATNRCLIILDWRTNTTLSLSKCCEFSIEQGCNLCYSVFANGELPAGSNLSSIENPKMVSRKWINKINLFFI